MKHFVKKVLLYSLRFRFIIYIKRLKIFLREIFFIRFKNNSFNVDSNLEKFTNTKRMKILLAGTIGGNDVVSNFESKISSYLKDYGFEFHRLICDKVMSACFECNQFTVPVNKIKYNKALTSKVCIGCETFEKKKSDAVIHFVGEYFKKSDTDKFNNKIDSLDFEELRHFISNGINLGEHAYSATLRYFAKGQIYPTEIEEYVFRSFLKSAEIIRHTFVEMLKRNNFDVVFVLHGLYIPHGVIKDVCNKNGIRVIVWNLGYRKNTFIFSEGETYHKTMISEPKERWENLHLKVKQKALILQYLNSRRYGNRDWISFVGKPRFKINSESKLHKLLNSGNKNILLLTNVGWDAQIHYENNVFSDMYEWIYRTIEWFINKPNVNLIIRVHPAEVNSIYPSAERIEKIIFDRYGQNLSSNILVIDSSDPTSTYVVAESCDLILIYGTKMGVELAVFGKPIIVSGEAWIRGKNLTIDISSKDNYEDLLEKYITKKLTFKPNEEQALKYAHHYFFRRLFELDFDAKTNDHQIIFNKNLSKFIYCLREKVPFEADFYS